MNDFNNLLVTNHLTVFSLGAYLGPDLTDDDWAVAKRRGECILIHFGIIPNDLVIRYCHCGRVLYRIADVSRKLGYRFKCSSGHRISPTMNTFLEYVHSAGDLGAYKIMQMVYMWVMKANTATIKQEVNVSQETAVVFTKYFRDVATKIAHHDYKALGDSQDIVEVDETHLFKAKYNVGRAMAWNFVWLFGGISRTTKKVFGKIVPDRSTDTLLSVMQKYIDHDAFICSDMWRAYNMCGQIFSGHGVVNHSMQFLEPPKHLPLFWVPVGRFNEECLDRQWDGAPPGNGLQPLLYHTQHIERSWKELKRILSRWNAKSVAEHILMSGCTGRIFGNIWYGTAPI